MPDTFDCVDPLVRWIWLKNLNVKLIFAADSVANPFKIPAFPENILFRLFHQSFFFHLLPVPPPPLPHTPHSGTLHWCHWRQRYCISFSPSLYPSSSLLIFLFNFLEEAVGCAAAAGRWTPMILSSSILSGGVVVVRWKG